MRRRFKSERLAYVQHPVMEMLIIPTVLTRQNESISILVSTTETMAQRLMCVGLLMRLQRVVELALENKAVTDLCIFGGATTPIHISRPTLQKCIDTINAERSQ